MHTAQGQSQEEEQGQRRLQGPERLRQMVVLVEQESLAPQTGRCRILISLTRTYRRIIQMPLFAHRRFMVVNRSMRLAPILSLEMPRRGLLLMAGALGV